MKTLSFLLITTITSLCEAGETLFGTVINPSQPAVSPSTWDTNPVWTLGETQTVQWTTTYTNYTITLWQQVGCNSARKGPSIFQTETGTDGSEFNWIVQDYAFDLASSPVFFLWLMYNPDDSAPSISSRYFNISAPPSTSSTPWISMSTPSTPLPTTTTTNFLTSTTSPPSESTDTLPILDSQHSSSNSLSSSDKVWIVIGAVALVVITCLLGVFLVVNLRRNKTTTPVINTLGLSGCRQEDTDWRKANTFLLGHLGPVRWDSQRTVTELQ